MPALASTTEFIDLLRQSGIYQGDSLDEVLSNVPGLPEDPVRAATVLVQHGLLTRFQAKHLLNGRSKGFRLGPYVIQDQLGQGGMGTVFLAEHAALRRMAALKVLTPPKDADDIQMAIERFLREARAAAALDHPNIVRIHDVAQQGNVYYLGLEYVDGDTLEQLLKKGGPITPSRAVGYIAQAAAGLQHADERGFIHRDIKPSNLILTKDQKTVKILDMGLARSFSSEEDKLTERLDSGVVTGTVDFISPEQSLGCPQIDIRGDIYSLGATFFALLTGKPPFQGNTTQKLAQHQMKPAPNLSELDPTLPKGLAAVVTKMLAKKPKDRYQTPAEVIAALAPWLGNSKTILAGGVVLPESAGSADTARCQEEETATEDAGVPVRTGPNTVSEEAARTSRRLTRRKKRLKAVAAQNQKKMLIGGVGVAFVGVVVAMFAFGGSKKPEPVANAPGGNPAVAPPVAPPVTGAPSGPAAPPRNPTPGVKLPPPPAGTVLYHADFAALQPTTRFVPVGDKVYAQQLGNQNLPLGWALNHHDITTAADYIIGDVSGARALGVRHVRGGRTEVMCRADRLFGTLAVGDRLTFRVVYQFEGAGAAHVGVKTDTTPYTRHVIEPLAPTNGEWRQAEFTFTRPDNDPMAFICYIAPVPGGAADGPAGTLWLRSIDVWPTGQSGAAPPVPPGRYAGWKTGPSVWSLDTSAIVPFRVSKEGYRLLSGTAERLPKGVRAGCWKPNSTGEFRCQMVNGSTALGLTNFTSEKSAQLTFDLENEIGAALTPGKVYRITVGYMTQNDASGLFIVQTPESKQFRNVLMLPLPKAENTWKTVSGEFERQDGAPVRLNFENFTVGEGNIVYLRSVAVTELVKPN